jgi:hypothetical protein
MTLGPMRFFEWARFFGDLCACAAAGLRLNRAVMDNATPGIVALVPFPTRLKERVMPFLVPYYLMVAAALGAITVVFVVVIALLVMVVANFNVLDWIE